MNRGIEIGKRIYQLSQTFNDDVELSVMLAKYCSSEFQLIMNTLTSTKGAIISDTAYTDYHIAYTRTGDMNDVLFSYQPKTSEPDKFIFIHEPPMTDISKHYRDSHKIPVLSNIEESEFQLSLVLPEVAVDIAFMYSVLKQYNCKPVRIYLKEFDRFISTCNVEFLKYLDTKG